MFRVWLHTLPDREPLVCGRKPVFRKFAARSDCGAATQVLKYARCKESISRDILGIRQCNQVARWLCIETVGGKPGKSNLGLRVEGSIQFLIDLFPDTID